MSERIVIRRDELYEPSVDEAIARERAMTQRGRPPAPEVSPLRRVLLSSTFYLPVAGALASFVLWLALEPSIHDTAFIRGPVTLVNDDPFEFRGDGEFGPAVVLTVGGRDVVALEEHTALERGADGAEPFASLASIGEGTAVELSGQQEEGGSRVFAMAIRPAPPSAPPVTEEEGGAALVLLFPLTAVAIAAALALAEGAATRNWARTAERGLASVGLTLVFSFVAYVPAGLVILLGQKVLEGSAGAAFWTVATISGPQFVAFSACRSAAWACIGAALGVGMNLVRSTKVQLRNSVVGGALGGALGGVFFDPVSRFLSTDSWFMDAAGSRAIGLVAVGASVGYFVALVDRLASEAWIRVRTGPLAGKSFILHRTPTTLGSSPRCDVYLFKDAEVGPEHARIHRIGNRFEIEDLGSRAGTVVGDRRVRRLRLGSGDQIVLGGTVLEFEERRRGEESAGGRNA